MVTVVLLIAALGLILIAAELFTNSVEWVGNKLGLGEGVVGSVLAAVGTALPETLIPIVAILVVGGDHGGEVGIGAILGAPFMLATLAMFVTGTAVVVFAWRGGRTWELRVNSRVLGRDIRFFLLAYGSALAAAFVPSKPVLALAALWTLGLYCYYVYRHATDSSDSHASESEVLGRLHFHRSAEDPALAVVLLQLVVSLVAMLAGAYFFVEQVSLVAQALGVPSLILSLLITPIATELPEKFNSVLWVRQGKDTLALGNLTGAMVFQSAVPASFGMLFGHWSMGPETLSAFVSAAIAIVAAALIFGPLGISGRKLTAGALISGGIFYLLYVGYLFVVVI